MELPAWGSISYILVQHTWDLNSMPQLQNSTRKNPTCSTIKPNCKDMWVEMLYTITEGHLFIADGTLKKNFKHVGSS